MDELRWTLLILGALIIAGVYGYGRLQDWRKDGAPWKRSSQRREPFANEADTDLPGADPLLDDTVDDDIVGPARIVSATDESEPVVSAGEPEVSAADDTSAAAATESEPELVDGPVADSAGGEKVVVLTVMAPKNTHFSAQDLVRVLESSGLRLTDQGVLRRGLDTGEGTVALFTAANIVEPGTFDPETLETATTPGIALIMQLPGPFDGLATFEQMLTTAQRTAEQLGGLVLDGRRCDLTTQSIEHIREELLEYRRRAHLASRRGA